MKNTKVTLTVNECSEFHSFGESHEHIDSVEEALRLWSKIPPERMNGIKAIGVCLEAPGDFMDGAELDILIGNHFDLEVLEYVPDILENKEAQEMIKDLIQKMPEIEIRGQVPDQLSDIKKEEPQEQNTVRRMRHHR